MLLPVGQFVVVGVVEVVKVCFALLVSGHLTPLDEDLAYRTLNHLCAILRLVFVLLFFVLLVVCFCFFT